MSSLGGLPGSMPTQAQTSTATSPPAPARTVDTIDTDTLNTILGLNALKNSTTAAPALAPHAQPPESSSGSSSLSELDDEDNNEESQDINGITGLDEENDSEAETERLQNSPRKVRENQLLQRIGSGLRHHQSINDASDDGMDIDLLGARGPVLADTNTRTSPNTLAGTKRKRLGDTLHLGTEERASKKPNREGSADSSDISEVSDRSSPSSGEEQATSGGDSTEPTRVGSDQEAKADDEDVLKVDVTVTAEEVEAIEAEVEEEDEAASVKGEDEMAKKLKAIADLAPIEKLFNMFRDKLHDERLAALDAELDILNSPFCTHPDFLAQRLCIDARRDEKVHIENVLASLRQESLQRVAVAKRSVIHCQYFQDARGIREAAVDELNEMYCKIQSERRTMKSGEPHFVYKFEEKRSKRIMQQTAYNKEVSLLSGIAKHIGFPAAPDLLTLPASEIDEDLRRMGISTMGNQARLPRNMAYAQTLLDAARQDELGRSEHEQFVIRTPWAQAPQHPSRSASQQGNVNGDRRQYQQQL